MVRLTIDLPDEIAVRMWAAADGDVSGWMSAAAQEKLSREETRRP